MCSRKTPDRVQTDPQPLIDRKEWRRLKRDYNRYARRFAADGPVRCFCSYLRGPQYRALVFFRLSRVCGLPVLRAVLGWLARRAALRSGVEIGCPVGGGLIVPHWGPIKLNARRIGRDGYILQNVTVGDDYRTGQPVIGNNVFIGTGSTVVGDIRIGDNVVIGAMSFVNEDVPGNTMVAGNPARVVRELPDDAIRTMTTYPPSERPAR